MRGGGNTCLIRRHYTPSRFPAYTWVPPGTGYRLASWAEDIALKIVTMLAIRSPMNTASARPRRRASRPDSLTHVDWERRG